MSNSCWEKTSHVLTKGQNLKVNIKIEQEEQKLRVIQDWGGNKSTYFVRERRLDSLMREFLDFSFELGLICLIRHNHPRPKQREKGTEYIGFSRRPDERWIYVIDQYSKKNIEQITIEKHYRFVLESYGINYKPQIGGGQALLVSLDQAKKAIRTCVDHIDEMEGNIRKKGVRTNPKFDDLDRTPQDKKQQFVKNIRPKRKIIIDRHLPIKSDFKTTIEESSVTRQLMPVWKSIINCRRCQEQFSPCPILVSPEKGIFPRGFGLQPNVRGVDVVFLLNNPGDAYSSEKEYYKKAFRKGHESLTTSISDFVWKINTGQLPNAKRDNNYRGLNNVFSNKFYNIMEMGLNLYISQMVKCQTNKEGSWIKAISLCADHLLEELEILKPKAIISTIKRQGNTILNSITTKKFNKWHNRMILVGYPHGAARRAGQGKSIDNRLTKWHDWDDSTKELTRLLKKI